MYLPQYRFLEIFNSITYTVVSINISVLFDKTFCGSATKHGHVRTMQFYHVILHNISRKNELQLSINISLDENGIHS